MNLARRDLAVLALLVIGASLAGQWWSARARSTLGDEVAALARPGDIRMISSETCAICALARRWFQQHRVAFAECFIERDAQCRADFDAARAPGTPLIVVRGVPQLGFRPERLRDALASGT
ncbi:MAG: hypothetical protein AMXMBFR66_31730 [Pseudomonadota bacterium]|nr:hypothetical protein [Rubrivivax sp.]NLZ41908.1 hypothetical protein [Comamonadaceae bacterium]